jgi:hypothetical protein
VNNPQASELSLLFVACLLEICSTRTCEIRGTPETVASDPAGPPTRTGVFIAKNAAETIKKLWIYRCFTSSSFNCVHRYVHQSCARLQAETQANAERSGRLNTLDASGSPMTSKSGRFYTS